MFLIKILPKLFSIWYTVFVEGFAVDKFAAALSNAKCPTLQSSVKAKSIERVE